MCQISRNVPYPANLQTCHIQYICHIFSFFLAKCHARYLPHLFHTLAMWHICPCQAWCQSYHIWLFSMPSAMCFISTTSAISFWISGAVWCHPTRPAPSLLLCDFKAPTEFSSSKKSNLLSGRFLEIRKLRGRPLPPKGKTS